MDLRATKTHAEQQDEEAERLVRPAPKLKPPRRDRRREMVEVDSDPDTEEQDPDESRNYKDVGGSVRRVVARYLEARATSDKIKVRNRQTGDVVRVTEKTLKEKPSAYEKVEEEETTQALAEAGKQLGDLAKDNPPLKRVLDNLKKKGPEFQNAEQYPDTGIGYYSFYHDLAKHKKWPKGIDTLGDLVDALGAQSKAKPKKPEKTVPGAPAGMPVKPQAEKGAPVEEGAKKPKEEKPAKKPKEEKPSSEEEAKQDDAEMAKQVAKKWVEKGRHKKPEFKRFLEAIPTTDVDEATGQVLVLSPKGKKVPFERLPPEAQKNLIDSYSGEKEDKALEKVENRKREKAQHAAVQTLIKMGPEVSKALMELADPESKASKKVEELAKKHDPKHISPDKVFPELKGKLQGIKSLGEAKDVAEAAQEYNRTYNEKTIRKSPKFKEFLKSLPTSETDDNDKPLVLHEGKKVPFDALPEEAQRDLLGKYTEKARQEQAKADTRKKQEASSATMERMDPKVRDALMQLSDPNSEASKKVQELAKEHNLKDVHPERVFPELKGKLEGVKTLEDAKDMAEAARDYEALPEQEKAGVPDPPRRPVSDEEKNQVAVLLATHLPPDVAADLIARDIYPDDVQHMISTYQAGREQNKKVKDLGSFATQASEFYETDPTKVKPPKKWMKDGQEVSFDTLAPEEKAEAMRQHQMNVLAHSFAAREHLTSALSMPSALTGKPRVPPIMTAILSETMLTKKTPAEAHRMAQTAFETMMERGEHIPIKDSVARSLFWKLDPQSQVIARGFMQANDYHAAKDKFLGTLKGFSEWDSPKRIIEGLQEADEFFSKRDKIYGVGGHPQHLTAGSAFRKRVLERLQSLKPDKAAQVGKWVQKAENKEYEGRHKDWKKEHDAWETRRRKHQETRGKGGYREQGQVAEFDEPEPTKPAEPLGYKGRLEKASPAASPQDVLRLMKEARVVTRRFLISTYSGCESMGHRSDRSAVYHGIEPEAPAAYPGWGQAHQRDLGEDDYKQILASAQKWLEATVISRPAEGMVKDQQLRAALDLALQTSRYDNAINPVAYNMLLARLAGVPEPGFGQTLQTIRGSTCAPRSGEANGQSSNSRETETMTTKLSAEQSKRASEILGRLDTLAKEIQEKHASWGMSFDNAKKVVNGLDSVADSFEKAAFGSESFERRQREILAKVVQREADEPYMDNFVNPMEPIQTDADEPYMGAYGDDQSSAVQDGKSTVGRPLAP